MVGGLLVQRVHFVGGDDNRFFGAPQNIGDFVIQRRRFLAAIQNHDDDVGFLDGELRRGQNRGRVTLFVDGIEAAGVDQIDGLAPDVDCGIKSVARGALEIFDKGDALARQTVKKLALAHIGPANQSY